MMLELKIGFVNELGRLERMSRRLACEARACDGTELVVNLRQELPVGVVVRRGLRRRR
jgi:hypothetical protein